jgi:hypothetical protein
MVWKEFWELCNSGRGTVSVSPSESADFVFSLSVSLCDVFALSLASCFLI